MPIATFPSAWMNDEHRGLQESVARFLRERWVPRAKAWREAGQVGLDTWREAGKKDPNFLESESPLFVGRAIAALAADPKVHDRTGMLLSSWELGRDYKLSDYDGRRPDWGRHKIDFSVLPPALIDVFRTGTDLEIRWLTTLAARSRKFRAKIPS